jgi:hypothetical protein
VLGVALVVHVGEVLLELVHAAGEEGVHLSGGEGLVAGVGGDAEGLAQEHCRILSK